ncbi:hypothetical protein Hanom_Chr16g01489191 [Helianthus anomalus]
MNDEGVLPSIEEEQRAYNVILKNKEMNIDDFELGDYLGMD